jgi:hypothetical protein
MTPLPLPDRHLVAAEVHVLDPQPQTLQDPQPTPVEQLGDQQVRPREPSQDTGDLVASEDDRQPLGPVRPDDFQLVERPAEHLLVEEQQGAEGLGLGGGGHPAVDRQVGQEGVDLRLGHLPGVADAVEQDEPPGPVVVGVLGSDRVVADPQGRPQPVEQLRLAGRGPGVDG